MWWKCKQQFLLEIGCAFLIGGNGYACGCDGFVAMKNCPNLLLLAEVPCDLILDHSVVGRPAK